MSKFALPLLLLTFGCFEREAGPHEEEWGKVMYWEVMDSQGRTDLCTDASDWSAVVSGPVFSPGSFLMYRVEEGGQTAQGQSCTTLASSSCVDHELVWEIDGHILMHEAAPVSQETGGDCSIFLKATWTLVDEGETGLFQVRLRFEYEPDEEACDAIEAGLLAESPNGMGLAECTVTMDADVVFAAVN